MPEIQSAESVGAVEAPEISIVGGSPQGQHVDEPQAVQPMAPEPEAPKKVFGEFESEEDAIRELNRLRGFQAAVAQDRDVQALIAARQQAERQAEAQKMQVQAEEAALLDQYAEAVRSGNPDKALLTLVREIRSQSQRDAQMAIRRELDSVAEPLRAKQQLIESQTWTDLHPLSDEAVWLATEMGKLGYSKPDVANFLRRVGQKYAGSVGAPAGGRGRKSSGWGLESPDSEQSSARIDDKTWDKAVDKYWKDQGY